MATEDQVRLAERRLRGYVVQRVCMLFATAAAAYAIFTATFFPLGLLFYSAVGMCLLASVGVWTSRRGFTTSTATLLVGTLGLLIVLTLDEVGLVFSINALFMLIVMCGTLLGRTGAAAGTIGSVIVITVYALSGDPQILTERDPTLMLFTQVSELSMVGVLLYWSAAGQRRILAGLITTTSALDRTQRQYAELVNDLADGVVALDVEGVILSVNPAIERMLGHPASDIVGRKFWNLPYLTPASSPELREDFRRLLRGEELSRVQVELEFDDGRHIIEAAPRLYTRSDGALEISATIRDVTVEVRAAEDRAALEEQLQQSQRLESLGRLAGGVAHDFNNWLTLIVANTELLKYEIGEHESLDAITEAAHRSTGLTQQLLTFAQRQPTEAVTVQVSDAIEEFSPMLRRLAGRGVEIHTDLQSPDAVFMDLSQFEQMVMNLVLNACEAMNEQGQIWIRSRSETIDDQEWVVIDVIDDGPGVPDHVRPHLFEPFYTTKQEGTGLGLATVHGVVTEAGGTIELRDDDGRTQFQIRLPPSDVRIAAAAAAPAVDVTRTLRVLVVDDDDGVRRTVARVLQTDFDVHTASSAAAALKMLAEAPDVVVSDIVMPGMSGIELMTELRNRCPSVRVVLMSGYMAEGDRARTKEADAFIAKPFSPIALRDLVRKVAH